MRKVVLWLMVLSFASFFAGHLYELIVVVPNWKSGAIADVTKYNQFFSLASPADYYNLTVGSSFIFSIVGLASILKCGKIAIIFASTAILVVVIYAVYTYAVFLPTNFYIGAGNYDPAVLEPLVARWVFHEPIRFALIGVGLLASILTMENSDGSV
ncbi:MAG TPA: hypothetical protein PLP21_08330 [Pyrinomonadaceae bacterium]|nr:hypothetical protein [Acidobacteriota bacterium]HQZ96312.1 hypothetical protein [Pyrinomonadaceae bacterium]